MGLHLIIFRLFAQSNREFLPIFYIVLLYYT
jgi:hypothetical protein